MKLVEYAELKALSIGLGLAVGFLALSFLVTFYSKGEDKSYDRIPVSIPPTHEYVRYTEIPGMN